MWKCIVVAPSYSSFIAAGDGLPVDWSTAPTPGRPDVDALLGAAKTLLNGTAVDLVTIDMPVATGLITGRRVADNAISKVFGGKGCSVHTPNSRRPGPIADHLRRGFAANGYPLATTTVPSGTCPALADVFPHTALLTVLDASYRVPYKVDKAPRYCPTKKWPSLSVSDRRSKILAEWRRILDALSRTISDIVLRLPDAGSNATLKRYEDVLDALVCAWVGIAYLKGRAVPYGDAAAAIWSP
jgi:predicted RNase H-like nuclease